MLRIVLDILFPPACIQCGAIGCWVCETCSGGTAVVAHPVPRNIGVPLFVFGDFHQELIRATVLKLKSEGFISPLRSILRRADMSLLARIRGCVIVAVPTSKSACKRRGGNPAEWFARELVPVLGCVYSEKSGLAKVAGFSQRGRNREERREAAKLGFEVRGTCCIAGERVVLVDDVVTTGSTLLSCLSLLVGLGVVVEAVVCLAEEA